MFKQNISFEVWGGDAGKYRLRDNSNNILENAPEDTCERVAKTLSEIESEKKEYWHNQFLSILGFNFAGGGRIMANVGAGKYKKETSPINCTVMRQIPDSMTGIMDVAKEAALTLKAGCGVGYDFSTIRPKGSHVFGAGAATSGIISFMKIFDSICSTIMSGGSRRGAQMACLDVSSPEIEDFITEKRKDGMLRYFNCSVLITDAFMQAVEQDQNWDLWFWEKTFDKNIPKEQICLIEKNDIPYHHGEFNYFSFSSQHNEVIYKNCSTADLYKKKIYKTVKAKYIFDLITKSTYNFWEPGFLLVDRVNKENNLYFCETIRCSNPCVTGDTRLATQYGLMSMKELYDKQLSIKATIDNRAIDGSLGVSTKPAIPVFMTSSKAKVYKITTNHGYEIKATEWHEFHTKTGKLKLKDLKIGDTLLIQSGKGQFGNKGSKELGSIIGWITGDGHFTLNKAMIQMWGDDIPLASEVANDVNTVLKENLKENNFKNRRVAPFYFKKRNNATIYSTRLAKVLNIKYNFNAESKLRVPEVIWQGTEECVKAYLRALFQSDGTVNLSAKSKTCSVRLNSSYPELLKDIQILLANFGITSSIKLRRKAGYRLMPDGKGGNKPYFCQNNYELIMGNKNRDLFMKEIGFLSAAKIDKYIKWQTTSLKNKSTCFETKISEISYYSEEPVYDTTQNSNNSLIFNGLSTGNCGEQPLHPLTACLLGSMILPSYVKNEFEKNADFDFEKFAKDVRIASRLLDNVVEINNLPLKEMQEEILNKRRHGLGFTGLGSCLNMLRMNYGSRDSLEFLEKISYSLAKESLLENIELAKEKGCAPVFNTIEARELVLKSNYLSRLIDTLENKEKVQKDILRYGLRYSHATSIAPTGTLSLTWGNNCSNGIEPVFSNSYLRNIRDPNKKTKVQEEVFDYAYFLWKNKYGDKELPSYWKTTDDLNVNDHLKMQAIAQKWCDSAISKTINVPMDYSFEDFKNVYLEGWKLGLKGVTTYRPNPEVSSGVLTQKQDLENTEYTFELEDGSKITLKGSEFVEYDGEKHNVANLFDALKEGIYGNM